MILDILTPDKNVFSGEIKLVKIPGTNGSFEIMENHAPIVSTIDKGELKVIDSEGKETFYNVSGGIVECSNNKIHVLIESILD